jgi:Cu+-exporting ATPase
VVGAGKAASIGVLVSGPQVFEQSRDLDVVVFDKTGTLTLGEMRVVQADVPREFHALVAALADRSSHPVSVAVAQHFADSGDVELTKTMTVPGLGVRAEWAGKKVEFGSARFHPELQYPEAAKTTSRLFVDDAVVGSIAVADEIDPSAAATVSALQNLGIKVVMASGDQTAVAAEIALKLGITDFYAELSPADKIEIVKKLQADGKVVAMAGDGSNDAPALAQSDFAIAMGRGTGIAQATADITLLRPDLQLIPQSIDLARRTLRTIKVNLGWAFGYNIAAIPLAMSGNLNPVIAGIAMSASSVLVVTNSLRLRR